jgi:hypothetical protein
LVEVVCLILLAEVVEAVEEVVLAEVHVRVARLLEQVVL